MIKPSSRFLWLVIVFVLPSCGFHLRGQYQIPESLQYLTLNARVSVQLRDAVRRQLESVGVTVIDDLKDTPKATLLLENESYSKQINALASNGQINDYNLVYQVVFSLWTSDEVADEQKVFIDKQLVKISRILYVDQQTVLASENEERTLRAEMEQELARRILFRIQALTKRKVH